MECFHRDSPSRVVFPANFLKAKEQRGNRCFKVKMIEKLNLSEIEASLTTNTEEIRRNILNIH